MKSADPLKEQAFEVLFPCLAKIIEASSAPPHPNPLHDAKAVVIAMFRQICSVSLLLNPVPVPLTHQSTISDPISVNAIVRTILESYLMWEQMFITAQKDEDKEFWYFVWVLKSLKLKTISPPVLPEQKTAQRDEATGGVRMVKAKDVYQNMLRNIADLQTALRANGLYKSVQASGNAKRINIFNSHVENGWKVSAEHLIKTSMPAFHADKIYDHLSGAVHLGHVDARQVVYSKTHEEIMSFAELALTVVNVVLARLCEQYPMVFPTTAPIVSADTNVQAFIGAYREATHRVR